jgi:sugar phosphate isomerase/epimerase
MVKVPDLLATCWTSVGDVVPGRNGDVSPLSVEERVEAVANAGYRGFGIAAPDLAVVRATIGYPALAQLLEENGLRHVEVEYLQDWWTTGDRRRASDEVRELLLEAAAELGADHVKVGLGDRQDTGTRSALPASSTVLPPRPTPTGPGSGSSHRHSP